MKRVTEKKTRKIQNIQIRKDEIKELQRKRMKNWRKERGKKIEKNKKDEHLVITKEV